MSTDLLQQSSGNRLNVQRRANRFADLVERRDLFLLSQDLFFGARCDSIGSESGNFEDAVQRSIAYVKEAGVDAIWVNTLTKREEIAEACRRVPAPVIAPYYGPRPSPTFEEFQKLGAAGVLYLSLTTANGLQATWELLHEFKARGRRPLRNGASHAGFDPPRGENPQARRRVYP